MVFHATLTFLVAFFWLFACQPTFAESLPKVVLTTSSLTEREAVLHVAQDRNLFKRYGVDVTLVQVRNGPLAVAALSSGESHLHWGSVTSANLGAIAAGADLVFVAGFINRLSGTFVTHPRINTPADLIGKTIGVTAPSGGGSVFTLLALEHWGLAPERDRIQFRSLGDQAVIAQALSAGTIDAAYFGYAYGGIMRSKGFRVLADLDQLPIPYQGSGIISRRPFANSEPETLANVVRALLDAAVFIRNSANQAAVIKSMARGSHLVNLKDVEEGYRRVINLYERKIYPSADGIRNAIRVLGIHYEKIRSLRAEDLVVDSIAQKLEREGRFK